MSDTPLTDKLKRKQEGVYISPVDDSRLLQWGSEYLELARRLERHANAMAEALEHTVFPSTEQQNVLSAWRAFVKENT